MYIGNDLSKTIVYGDMATGQLLLGNPKPTGYVFKGNRILNVIGGIIADSMRVVLNKTPQSKKMGIHYQRFSVIHFVLLLVTIF